MKDGLARAIPIFQQALDLGPEERGAFLDEACGEDTALKAEVEELLELDKEEDELLDEKRLNQKREELNAIAGEQLRKTNAEIAEDPERIGEYRIVRPIGRGGMGIVYEAQQERPRRSVALKVLRPTASAAKATERFQQEAQILGLLQHPGIAQIFDVGLYDLGDGPQPYFAMELVDGVDLKSWSRDHREVDTKLRLFIRLCDAVQHAHERGIVHRDLKPENILVGKRDEPKILDFGVALATDADLEMTTMHTRVGQLVGTVAYMSPEQASGNPAAVSTASDVYSLGVLLFELLSGRHPQKLVGSSIPVALRTIQDEDPTHLRNIDTAFRGDLDTITARALEKDPARRYASAVDLGADVGRFLAHQPIRARPASAAYQLTKFARRHRGFTLGAALAVFALILGSSIAVWFALDQARLRGTALQSLYRANLAAIPEEVERGNHGEALALLEACAPDLRGWEWNHMRARIPPVVWSSPLPRYEQQAKLNTSPDGRFLAATDGLDSIAVFSFETGERLIDLPMESGVTATWISVSTTHVAALSKQARLRVFALADGELVLDRDLGQVGFSVEWSADGSQLAVSTDLERDPHRAREFDDRAIHAGPIDDLQLVAHGIPGTRVHWIEDDRRLVASAYFHVDVLDTADWSVSRGTPLEHSTAWDIDSTGQLFLCGKQDGRIGFYGQPWNGSAPDLIRSFDTDQKTGVRSTTISRNGETVAITTFDGDVSTWDASTGRLLYSEQAIGQSKVMLDPSGTRVAVRDRFELRVVSLGAIPVRKYIGHSQDIVELLFAREGRRMVSRDLLGEVRVWDELSVELLMTLQIPPIEGDPAQEGREQLAGQLALGPMDRELWLVREDRAFAVDLDLGVAFEERERPTWWTQRPAEPSLDEEAEQLPTLGREIQVAATSPDGQRIAVALSDGSVRLWDTAKEEYVLRLREHEQFVQHLVWSQDGRRLASAARDGRILVWESESPEALAAQHASFLAARAEVTPWIESGLDEKKTAAELADALWNDVSWSDDHRSAGLRILRELQKTGLPQESQTD